MKNNLLYAGILFMLFSFSFFACEKDDPTLPPKSSKSAIVLFVINVDTAIINGNKINIAVADSIKLDSLIPSIVISKGASIVPSSNKAMNFSVPVTYIVTAEDAVSKTVYTVYVTHKLSDLEQAKKDFQDQYVGTKLTTIGWTGNEATCNSGDVSKETRDKVLKRVNYYRALCGLPAVSLNLSQNKSCQDAALIMMANNTLTHVPSPSVKCWTQAGYDASSTANLAISWGLPEPDANHSINAVSGYIKDPGGGNEIVGHRSWLLHPALSAIGTGSVYDANHSYLGMQGAAANCIRWGDNLNGTTAGPGFIAYPPANYMPSALVFPRWSFAITNADFSNAMVTMKSGSTTYLCNIIARVPQQGSVNPAARVVWEPQGINITSDMDITVTVSNIQGAQNTSYTYTVKIFKVSDAARRAVDGEGKILIF